MTSDLKNEENLRFDLAGSVCKIKTIIQIWFVWPPIEFLDPRLDEQKRNP